MAVNADGSFDLTVTDWPQWRNLVFDLPEGLLAAGREYTLSVQEPYETPTVNMHVRTGGNGYGPLKLTYGKSSVTATPDAISITPNLTIINEKPDPTSGSLRNVRLKLEEGGEPTGWVPPVFSGGGYSNILPAVKTGDSWNGQFTCERLNESQYRVHGSGAAGWYSWDSETVTLPAGTYRMWKGTSVIAVEIHPISDGEDTLAGYLGTDPDVFEADGSIGLRFRIVAHPTENEPFDETVSLNLVRVSDDPGSGGGISAVRTCSPGSNP